MAIYQGVIGLVNVLFKIYPPSNIICIDLRDNWKDWFSWFQNKNYMNVEWFESDHNRSEHLFNLNSELGLDISIDIKIISPDHGNADYYYTTLSQENGIVSPTKLQNIWKNISIKEKRSRQTNSLSEIVLESINNQWLLIDCLQGVSILKNNLQGLSCFDLIVVRTLSSPKEEHLDILITKLSDVGFKLLDICSTDDPILVRAIFVRDYCRVVDSLSNRLDLLQSNSDELSDLNNELLLKNRTLLEEKEKLESSLKKSKLIEQEYNKSLLKLDKKNHKIRKYKYQYQSLKVAYDQLANATVALEKVNNRLLTLTSGQQSLMDLVQKDQEYSIDILKSYEKLSCGFDKLQQSNISLQNSFSKKLNNSVEYIENYIALNNYFNTGRKLSNYSGWPISPDLALFIVDRMNECDYDAVIEFGSGTSTELFAKIALMKQKKKEKIPKILSFDHLKEYYQKTMTLLNRGKLGKFVQLEYTPLVSLKLQDEDYFYYDCELVLKEFLADLAENARVLVLVDGPPGKTCKHARYPAVPTVRSSISSSQSIVADFMLDDFSRAEEKEVSQKWINYLVDKKVSFDTQVVSTSIKGLFFLEEVSFNN
ncbi:hypothetical protein [Ignatzschineria cameli]|uniref:Class I SAM-dependent methyltransferase n=1 Tax=Ignatzschineria cameli TaxID=2182793 RepID=A0ABX5KXT3_9GAMM|nr:hypothetical protein [Ignatzschineria cameli]PWD88520.1 hypothetical protein DC079_09315 [Ignatzschineria cameli]PWD89111.1 hypothetical protein DC081_09485 [Ignatzschineria cameli]PWD89959.1 hypothetical protein DC078_09260 [Ignatzschineria cameli]